MGGNFAVPLVKPLKSIFVLLLVLILIAAGCQPAPVQPTVTPTVSTPQPTATPTPLPLGSSGNPVMIGFVYTEDNPDAQAAIETLTSELTTRTGFSIGAVIYPTYDELMAGLQVGNTHAAWLQPLTYLYAKSHDLVNVKLLTNHFGTYFYGVQILANADSGLTSYFDPQANANTGEVDLALDQLTGLRPCWVDPGSISGYIYPFGLLRQHEIELLPGAYLQSHTAVIRGLYIKGLCDFGATFAYSGDPRTSSAVLSDLPDAEQRVVVLWRTDADIPNMNFSTVPTMDEAVQKSLLNTLMDLVKTDSGKDLLSRAAGGYDIQDLKIVDDSIYDPLRQAISYAGVDIADWLGR